MIPRAAALLLLVCCASFAQRDLRLEQSSQKLALIVGIEAYPKWPLRNPVNDAKAMDLALRENGFRTEVLLNSSLRALERGIDQFVGKLRAGDIALFYYAGHGIQLGGENYLVPVDFDAQDEADAKYVSYAASRVQDRIEATGARLSLLMFDACRNNPFRATRGGGGGLAAMNTGKGTLIALATSPGKTADDNPRAGNGLFTSHLVAALREPGLSLDQVFNRVRERVYTESGQKQLPWTVSSVIGEFYFNPGAQAAASAPSVAPPQQIAVQPFAAPRQTAPPVQPPAPAQGAPSQASPATMAYSRADYNGAIALAQEVLRADAANVEALYALTASYYSLQQYDQFAAVAAQALRAGAVLPFRLGHHHTLSGMHPSYLKLSSTTVGFDPLGGAGCNSKAFTLPVNSILSSNLSTTANGEVFLNVRIRDEQKKTHYFNFADPDSTVDTSQGLPIVRPSPKASRQLQAIAAVLRGLQSP